jgi:hypothetical protein
MSQKRLVAAAALVLALAGCSSAPPPPRGAAKEMEEAERALTSANNWKAQKQIDYALTDFRRARDLISKAKDVALDSEMAALRNMDEECRKNLAVLETMKVAQPTAPAVTAPPPTGPVAKIEDPEARKRREEAEAKKKLDEKARVAADITAKITDATVTAPAPKKAAGKDDDDAEVAAAEAKTKKAADKNEAGEEEAQAVAGRALMPAAPPFPAITEKSAPIDIVKVEVKGKAVVAYFQIYNSAEQGRRIMNTIVFFQNANSQPLLRPEAAVVFPFTNFKPNAAKIIEGQSVEPVTLGSHQVTGFDGLRMVAVGELDRPQDVKRVGIKVIFQEGAPLTGVWTDAGAPGAPDTTIKALGR